MDKYKQAAEKVVGLMVHDPSNPYRQGYSFANALMAVAELDALDQSDVAIVAEHALIDILKHPDDFPSATSAVFLVG